VSFFLVGDNGRAMTNKEGVVREIETAGRTGRMVRGVPPYDLPVVIDQQETVVTPSAINNL
jgi:hypothetical protein